MPPVPEPLKSQIEAAFDYRGHVTVLLKSGEVVDGFLFNRQYKSARQPHEDFVELALQGKSERRRLLASEIASIALTGEDCAAGKSYEDHLKRKASGAP